MMTNQLTEAQRAGSGWLGQKPFAAGRGFGLGGSGVLETAANDFMRRGGVGTGSWTGRFGGWGKADPDNGTEVLFPAHNRFPLRQKARAVVLGLWAPREAFKPAG